MGYCVLHYDKQTGNSPGLSQHIERGCYRDGEWVEWHPTNVDPSRTHLNRELISGELSRDERIMKRIREAGVRTPRKDQVRALTLIMSASVEDMQRIQQEGKFDSWCQSSLKWAQETHGEENVVSAVLHMDEKTPHLHVTVVPIVQGMSKDQIYREKKAKEAEEKGIEQKQKRKYKKQDPNAMRLCAADVMARTKLKEYQTSYAEAVAEYGLERGIEGSTAKHIDINDWYKTLVKEVNQKKAEKEIIEEEIETRKGEKEQLDGVIAQRKQESIHIDREIESKKEERKQLGEEITQKKAEIGDLQKQKEDLSPVVEAIRNTGKGIGDAISNIGRGIGEGLKEMGTYAIPSKARDREKKAEKKAEESRKRELEAKAKQREAEAERDSMKKERDRAVNEKRDFINNHTADIHNIGGLKAEIEDLKISQRNFQRLLDDSAEIGLSALQTLELTKGKELRLDSIRIKGEAVPITPLDGESFRLKFDKRLLIQVQEVWKSVKSWVQDARQRLQEWRLGQESPGRSKGHGY